MQQDLRINGKVYLQSLALYADTEGVLDDQYATVIAILFVSYCPVQIPSNMVIYIPQFINLFFWHEPKYLDPKQSFQVLWATILYGTDIEFYDQLDRPYTSVFAPYCGA